MSWSVVLQLLLLWSAAFVAIFLAPLAVGPHRHSLDEMPSWAFKGPHASTLTPKMSGVYSLVGNQKPGTCTESEQKDKALCRGKVKRSEALALDTSFCKFDREAGTITCSGPFMWFSAHSSHDGRLISRLFKLLRTSYTIDQRDSEFFDKGRSELLEGAMTLRVLGVEMTHLAGNEYRVTMESNSAGSRIQRYTWWGKPAREPQSKRDANEDWHYVMKRVMTEDGKVDRNVLQEMKSIFGDSVLVP